MSVRLTPVQKKVVKDMRDGWVLLTDASMKGAEVAKDRSSYHIDNGVFWRLEKKGVIFQELSYPFNYVLTPLGRQIKIN